jgi:hypothetical protein
VCPQNSIKGVVVGNDDSPNRPREIGSLKGESGLPGHEPGWLSWT